MQNRCRVSRLAIPQRRLESDLFRGSDRRIRILRIKDGKTLDIPASLEDKVLPNDEIKIRSRFF